MNETVNLKQLIDFLKPDNVFLFNPTADFAN